MSIIEPNSLLPVPSDPLRILGVGAKPIYFSLVIPTYQEAENINKIVSMLSRLLDEAFLGNYELIVVDDDSPDGTWEVAQSLMPE